MSGLESLGTLGRKKEVVVNAWMSQLNWAWIIVLMIPWVLLIGAVGCAAVHEALRAPHGNVPMQHP